MICPKCHRPLNEYNVCPNCGYKQEEEKKTVDNADAFFDFAAMPSAPVESAPVEMASSNPSEEKQEGGYHIDQVTNDNLEVFTVDMVSDELQKRKTFQQNMITDNTMTQEEVDQENKYDEYDLLASYIGPKSEKLTNDDFSFCAFLLGPIYLLFRKCYLFFVLFLIFDAIVSVIAFFLNWSQLIISLIDLVATFLLGVVFKKIYDDLCLKRVKKIMAKNKGKTFTEVSQECARKGGTSIGAAIAAILLRSMIIGIFSFAVDFREEQRILTEAVYEANFLSYTITAEETLQKMKEEDATFVIQGKYDVLSPMRIQKEGSDKIIEITQPIITITDAPGSYFTINEEGRVENANLKVNSRYITYCAQKIKDQNEKGFKEC